MSITITTILSIITIIIIVSIINNSYHYEGGAPRAGAEQAPPRRAGHGNYSYY